MDIWGSGIQSSGIFVIGCVLRAIRFSDHPFGGDCRSANLRTYRVACGRIDRHRRKNREATVLNSSHKKPGVAFWATVMVVVLLLAYPLSFGPACWLVGHRILPKHPNAEVFKPLLAIVLWECDHAPKRCGPIGWWASLGHDWRGVSDLALDDPQSEG